MKQYTVVEYEQSDFDAVKENMTAEEAAEILSSLPRGWFPYSLPEWGQSITFLDYDNYRICCAIEVALKALERLKKEKNNET